MTISSNGNNPAAGQLIVQDNARVTVPALTFGDADPATANARIPAGASITVTGNGQLTVNGPLDLNRTNPGTTVPSNNTLNLNGGTTTLQRIGVSNPSTTHKTTINFNGGLLKANSTATDFLNAALGMTAQVQVNGAKIDTNSFDVTVSQPLVHDTTSGAAAIDGGLTKNGGGVLTLTTASTYTGGTTINGGIIRIPARTVPAAVGHYSFDDVRDASNNPITSGSLADGVVVVNGGTGGAAMNGTVNNNDNALGAGNQSGQIVTGKFGNGLSLDGLGSSVDIASKIVDQAGGGSWTMSLWIKTNTAGSSFVSKNTGTTTWAAGDSVFYLASNPISGTAGNFPTAVRNSGGFLQGNQSVTDDAWHMVTFVDTAGTKAVYVDGVATTLNLTGYDNADIATLVRLGYNTDTLASSDGNVHYAGVMDEVQFFGAGLNQTQITQLLNTNTVTALTTSIQALPSTTAVNITASGAGLDMNGNDQVIGSLAGVAGSTVTMGIGNLTAGGNNTDTTFAGAISGSGSLTKVGTGTMTMTGNNTYTGGTTVSAGKLIANKLSNGTLTIASSASAQISAKGLPNSASGTTVVPALSIASGASLDLTNNSLVIDYTGAVGTLVGDTRAMLVSGQLTSSSADATHKLGYGDNAVLGKTTFGGVSVDSSSLLVKYTYGGDSNLDGQVDVTDLGALATNWQTSSVWTGGDFNYDGFVDVTDLGILATNWQAGVGSPLGAGSFDAALSAVGLGNASVPEPASLGLIGLALLGLTKRQRRA